MRGGLLVALAGLTLGAAVSAKADPLVGLRWKARPVVVLADSHDDPRVARQIAALEEAAAALGERNIKVLSETRRAGPLRRSLGIEQQGFAVVLVGKDGDVKKVWRDVVAPSKIFEVIDAMPMRRQEMRG